MSTTDPIPLVRVATARDDHSELLEGSRWLRRDQAAARQLFVESLAPEQRQQLFIFEAALKAVAAYPSRFNRPGQGGAAFHAHDFRGDLREMLGLVQTAIRWGEAIVEPGRIAAPRVRRYYDSVLVADPSRLAVVKRVPGHETPLESLAFLLDALRGHAHHLAAFGDVAPLGAPLFQAAVEPLVREIQRNIYFDPTPVIELRPEYDGLQSGELLRAVQAMGSVASRRATTLTLLVLFRLRRYAELLPLAATPMDRGLGLALLTALRSDGRALSFFLRHSVRRWLAAGYGTLFQTLDAAGLLQARDQLEVERARLRSLGHVYSSLGWGLRLELKRLVNDEHKAFLNAHTEELAGEALQRARDTMVAWCEQAILLLAREIAPAVPPTDVLSVARPAGERLGRLRRDVWMFQQILRAFSAKAKDAARQADSWFGSNVVSFVREFDVYFRSLGYEILRNSDYDNFEAFLDLLEELRHGEFMEAQRLTQITSFCEEIQFFLDTIFEQLDRHRELAGQPFNKKEAALTLKSYLGR